ncbi:MAG TPA: DNA alkylation repair protein [Fimbriimonas sp.]|nr:DNA alkylation repair protein [Fimbriimonas sp.]
MILDSFSLKDQLFNVVKVRGLAAEIEAAHPEFDADGFVQDCVARFPELELKARVTWMSECLRNHLPPDYRTAVGVILAALPAPNDPTLSDNDFGDFIHAPYPEFVALYGATEQDVDFSLEALRQITMRFSAEYAIRTFINKFPDLAMDALLRWSKDDHYHVRRLASEGTRPSLPWGQNVSIKPELAVPILHNLFHDKTRFVTRSVANHVNDITKKDPELALRLLSEWQSSGRQDEREMMFITKHSLRTLIKRGHPESLRMLGLAPDCEVELSDLVAPSAVAMDSELEFSFSLKAEVDTRVIVDFAIHFVNKRGASTRKVFKLKEFTLQSGIASIVTKRHMLKRVMTTRTLYPGQHSLEILVNGASLGHHDFHLSE